MKTKRIAAMLLVVAFCLLVCSGCGNKNYIGDAKAKEIALAHAGKTVEDIRDFECELDEKFLGTSVYEIEFDVGFDDYEYEINAVTGEILKYEVD